MRRILIVLTAVCVPAALAFLAPGCGGSDSTGPEPEACGIELYTPTPGQSFRTGDTADIRWHASGGGNVSVVLLKGGQPVHTVAASTPNDGYQPWQADTYGGTSGDDYVLRVASLADPACADSVGIRLTNTAGCAVTLTTSPDSTMVAGEPFPFTWTSDNTSGHITLELWQGNLQEEFAGTIAADVPDTGSYLWLDTDSFDRGTGADYYVHIKDTNVAGCESEIGPMTMIDPVICTISVETPPAGSVIAIGDTVAINFDSQNTTGFVKIRLYALATFVPGGYIADHVPAIDRHYDWVASDYGYTGADNMYRIVVIDENNDNCYGRSGTLTIH